jgi:choline dehydrogenase-like flavoprotein
MLHEPVASWIPNEPKARPQATFTPLAAKRTRDRSGPYAALPTAPMARPTSRVIDHELRVHGLEALRVADAGVMPTVVSGNTNAACIMIGEKCADLMLAAR